MGPVTQMLLTIDIGNTAVTMGVFRGGPATYADANGASPVERLVTTLRVAHRFWTPC